MLKKIKNLISKTDRFLYQKFGTEKKLYYLENLKEAKIIFECLNDMETENKVRFVGGCVRKALNNKEIDDIDLATSLRPEKVKQKLNKRNIKVIDTGISHGTLTAYINNLKFEITSLREDVETDGRHASVSFTENWEKDASRRDLTINAIYADIEGKIFDPFNGISDLDKGVIKFIGSPEERIKEDYLRILRYFRFFAQYSKTKHDPAVINFIKQNINGINKISKERIFDEVKKILLLKNIDKLFVDNDLKKIILNIFPQFKYYKRLKNIKKLSKNIRFMYDVDLILATLILDESKEYEYFCYKYKTSNNTKNRLKYISENIESIKTNKFNSEENIKKLIYMNNKKKIKDLFLFSIHTNNKLDLQKIDKIINYIDSCKIPKFPISGDDLKKFGYEAGKDLGKKLKSLEEMWIKNNFIIDKKEIKKSLDRIDRN